MITLWFLLSQALAHPFSQEDYSLRTAVRVSEKGVVPLVALEIPIPIALREIGAKTDENRAAKKRKIKRYNQQQWNNLAESLVFTIDGVPAKGKWRAIDHPANGKASEGFFVYLVSFQFKSPVSLNPGSEIIIDNQSYTDKKMVYSGSATATSPWKIVSSTANEVLAENADSELANPKRWSTDERLRTMVVKIDKAP